MDFLRNFFKSNPDLLHIFVLFLFLTAQTYLTLEASTYDGKTHDVQIYYDNTAEIAVNSVTENVIWGQ